MFIQYNENPRDNFRAGDCVVRAISVATADNIVDNVYNRLKNCPVSSTPVYGNTPIFTCPQNVNAGCGCNGSF